MKIFLKCISSAILGLLFINTIIFAIELYNAERGSDWSMAYQNLTYSVNGNKVGYGLNSLSAYLVIAIGFVSQYFNLNKNKSKTT